MYHDQENGGFEVIASRAFTMCDNGPAEESSFRSQSTFGTPSKNKAHVSFSDRMNVGGAWQPDAEVHDHEDADDQYGPGSTNVTIQNSPFQKSRL